MLKCTVQPKFPKQISIKGRRSKISRNMSLNGFKDFSDVAELSKEIQDNPSSVKHIKQLKNIISSSPPSFVKCISRFVISSFFPYISAVSKKEISISLQDKQQAVETLHEFFIRYSIDQPNIFFNFYTFLLLEIYDYTDHKVKAVSEEFKLSVIKCMTSLMNSNTFEVIETVYIKQNVPKFSQIIYVCSEIAKKETARNLRSEAINCIMAVGRVLNDSDLSDRVLASHCADTFMFFLPGLSSTLMAVALEDQRVGHKLITLALKAYGRIISLVVQDYRASDQTIIVIPERGLTNLNPFLKNKLKNKQEIDEYLNSTLRNVQWYRKTDENLNVTLRKLRLLTYHSHDSVRSEMVSMAGKIIKHGAATIPMSASTLLEHLIILSQDSNIEIADKSRDIISDFSDDLTSDNLLSVYENLEDGFYNSISSLPRNFNSVDDGSKTANLNLLLGYVELFGEHNLNRILLSPNMLSNLHQNLLHITELETCNVSLLEDYTLPDFSSDSTLKQPWINFRHFQDDSVKFRLSELCTALSRNGCFEALFDLLVETFLYDVNKKKESIYLLNCLITGLGTLSDFSQYSALLKNVINLYTEETLNDLSVALDPEEYLLEQIQDNINVIALITEGLGRLSEVLKMSFLPYLLNVLYLVLEKAGCGHPVIRASGLWTLNKLTLSCGYNDVTQLIQSNFHFFSFQVNRKLIKLKEKEGVLNVLSVVLQYCSVDVLLPMKSIIEEVLLLSCDRFKEEYATAYLKLFKMFIVSLRKWYKIELEPEQIKSRKQKETEQEHFKVTGIDYTNDFSDDVMGNKTAEEMYLEDLEEKNADVDTIDEVEQKPQPPLQVQLAALILKRSLHFLPSKQQSRQLLVLEILEKGIELLKEWENELLPVVHQIWSPLIQRFQNESDYLTMRNSVRLVATLARLSKEFIRMRVVKELLPKLKNLLEESAQTSYLKDKGSAYRYSQQYKFQLEVLTLIPKILYNLDVDEIVIDDVISSVKPYLSDKQPQPLQVAAVSFFITLAQYDSDIIKEHITKLQSLSKEEYSKNLERIDKIRRIWVTEICE